MLDQLVMLIFFLIGDLGDVNWDGQKNCLKGPYCEEKWVIVMFDTLNP